MVSMDRFFKKPVCLNNILQRNAFSLFFGLQKLTKTFKNDFWYHKSCQNTKGPRRCQRVEILEWDHPTFSKSIQVIISHTRTYLYSVQSEESAEMCKQNDHM